MQNEDRGPSQHPARYAVALSVRSLLFASLHLAPGSSALGKREGCSEEAAKEIGGPGYRSQYLAHAKRALSHL
ncbi:hypothetical protein GQ54DRAFT_298950, partial [Martensiomyces pterosporus]